MGIEQVIMKNMVTDELVSALEQAEVKNFIRDLSFTYGLKVIRAVRDTRLPFFTPKSNEFLLGYDTNGMAVCKVWTDKSPDNKVQYCLRTPFAKKERGSDPADRETWRSVKISTLMGTLKRHDVLIKAFELITNHLKRRVEEAMSYQREVLGNSGKSINELKADDVHALLLTVLGESPSAMGYHLDINKCKIVLDKYNQAHTIKLKKVEEENRFFGNPLYAIGADGEDLVIGIIKRRVDDKADKIVYEIHKPFERVRNLDNYPDLIAPMTMAKIALEDKKLVSNIVPRHDGFSDSLDMAFTSGSEISEYHYQWLFTPFTGTL